MKTILSKKIQHEIAHLLIIMIVIIGLFLIGKGITGMAVLQNSSAEYDSFSILMGMMMILVSFVMVHFLLVKKE